MQVGICWMSVHDFECLTSSFEHRVEVMKNSHGLDCPVGRWQEPLSSVLSDGGGNRNRGIQCLVIPDLFSAVTTHDAQFCALSLNDSVIVIVAYWAVFLSHRPPADAAVAAHSVILSRRLATVSAVDVVKIFVI